MVERSIPPAVLANHIAILGKTGSGKTSTEKLAVEQAVAEGFRVCVLDTLKSDWWGIISSGDGANPGLPFKILGGPRGHVPLHSSAGKAIGQLVGEGKLPLSVIDMAEFEPGGVQRFFVDFAQALMRHIRGVLFLVIEEAHEIAPKERAGFGAENMSIHYAKKLATAGRSKGIRLIVATQRVQSLHNAVLGSCETVITHRLSTPADQKPVLDWLKANVADDDVRKAVAGSLSSLPTGTGWLCSGEAQIFERVAFPKFETYDNHATPTADAEEIHVAAAPVDQDELRAIIGDAVKEAEANDPKLLNAEIAGLKRQLAAAGKGAAPEWPDQRGEVAQLRGALIMAEKRLSTASALFEDVTGFLTKTTTEMAEVRESLAGLDLIGSRHPIPEATASGRAPAPAPRPDSRTPDRPSPPPRVAPPAQGVAAGETATSVPPGTRPTLSILVGAYPAGMTRGQVAALVGVKKKGTTLSSYLSRLRTANLIEERGGLIFAAASGVEAIGEVVGLPEPGEALARAWGAKLPGTASLVEALIASHPRWRERDDLAAELDINPKGTTLSSYISRLFTSGVVEKSPEGLRLSGEVMGDG